LKKEECKEREEEDISVDVREGGRSLREQFIRVPSIMVIREGVTRPADLYHIHAPSGLLYNFLTIGKGKF
jgi:hypothetical protein